MSAFVQAPEHIRVLVWAALAVRRHRGESELYWHVPADVDAVADPRKGLEVIGWSRGPQRVVRKVTRESADWIGQMLVDENVRSVTHRYEGTTVGDERYGFEYGRGPQDTGWTDREVMMALRGYRYQACEHEGWASSEAASFVDALEGRLIGRWTDGLTSHPWSIDEGMQSEASSARAAFKLRMTEHPTSS